MLHANSDLVPFSDFETASRAALSLLHQRLGFDLWMMTRTDGNDWIVLQAEAHGYKVSEGSVFRWADSFCSQMVLGLGPRIAPVANEIPAYANAPIGRQVAIGAYIGVPIKNADGSLFGTLCAIDPSPQDESIHSELPWIELISRMLGTILVNEMKSVELARRLEQSSKSALLDVATGLLNRQGWDQSIATEEARARRYGSPACVFRLAIIVKAKPNVISSHLPDDTLIHDAADCIRQAAKSGDPIAYFGDGEFALLGVECDLVSAEALATKIIGLLDRRGIGVLIGKAMREPSTGLVAAMRLAETSMHSVMG